MLQYNKNDMKSIMNAPRFIKKSNRNSSIRERFINNITHNSQQQFIITTRNGSYAIEHDSNDDSLKLSKLDTKNRNQWITIDNNTRLISFHNTPTYSSYKFETDDTIRQLNNESYCLTYRLNESFLQYFMNVNTSASQSIESTSIKNIPSSSSNKWKLLLLQ